jgi:hypothetical protein
MRKTKRKFSLVREALDAVKTAAPTLAKAEGFAQAVALVLDGDLAELPGIRVDLSQSFLKDREIHHGRWVPVTYRLAYGLADNGRRSILVTATHRGVRIWARRLADAPARIGVPALREVPILLAALACKLANEGNRLQAMFHAPEVAKIVDELLKVTRKVVKVRPIVVDGVTLRMPRVFGNERE